MNAKIIAIAAAIVIGAGAAYAIAPYFTGSTVNEELPEGVILPSADEPSDAMVEPEDAASEGAGTLEDMDIESFLQESDMFADVDISKLPEGTTLEELRALSVPDDIKDEATAEDMMVGGMSDAEISSMEMETATHYSGTFVGVNDGIHNAEGDAYVIPLEDGNSILRLENFAATNGPGLHVYLATDKGASEYVDLGKLKANNGNQNYGIPEGTDLDRYDKVLIWCEPFRVLFGSALLSPQ